MHSRLSRNALLKLVAELVGRGAWFALNLWAARRLGESGFGLYSYGYALGFVLVQIADLGLQVTVAREVAVAGRLARTAVWTALRIKLFLSLPVLALLAVFSIGRPAPVQASFLLLGAALLAHTFLEFAAYIFRGEQRLEKEAGLLAGARLLAAALGGVALGLGGGLLWLTLSLLIAEGAATIWAFRLLVREGWLAGPGLGGEAPWRGLLRQAMPIGLATFLSIAYTRLAVFLLEARLGEAAVAQFSAAQRLVEPTQIVPAALLAAVFPAYASALHREPGWAKRLSFRSSLLLALGGGGLALAFWFLAPVLIPLLYGEAYQNSVRVLQFLGLTIPPAYLNYSLTHLLIARGQQRFLTPFVAAMLALHAGLGWRLIPGLGAAGPAVSAVAAEGLLALCCLFALTLVRPGQIGAPAPDGRQGR